jgi:hypothetical protein
MLRRLTEDDIVERAERRKNMIRAFIGKGFKLPVVGRIYAGLSFPLRRVARCNRCGTVNREAGFVIGVLIGILILRWLVKWL